MERAGHLCQELLYIMSNFTIKALSLVLWLLKYLVPSFDLDLPSTHKK
jgi:hypothetical protein